MNYGLKFIIQLKIMAICGQLFGDRDAWNVVESINTFSIDKVKEYLKNYNIIKLEEIEYVRESDNKKWHFYDIIAQKKVGDKHE